MDRCSDSRAGDQCLATLPGEIFVHRNIANIVNANDISSQGVIQFAIDVLKVKKSLFVVILIVVVFGHHYQRKNWWCFLDLWLNPVRHIRAANLKLLEEYNQDPKLKAKIG